MDIISVTPIMCNYLGILLVIFGILFFFFWIVTFFFIGSDSEGIAMASIFFLLAGFIINGLFKTDYTGYNKYIVRINDSVTFNEVIRDYDIIKIDEENNLITLQNKVENENEP